MVGERCGEFQEALKAPQQSPENAYKHSSAIHNPHCNPCDASSPPHSSPARFSPDESYMYLLKCLQNLHILVAQQILVHACARGPESLQDPFGFIQQQLGTVISGKKMAQGSEERGRKPLLNDPLLQQRAKQVCRLIPPGVRPV